MSNEDTLIKVENLYKVFGSDPQAVMPKVLDGMGKDELLAETGHTLGLKDINLDIKKGEIFVIMGLSGSGKSTLIRHFNRLIDPTQGAILVDGIDVMDLGQTELENFRRHKMSMVFQRFGLLPHRSVIDNVAFGLQVQNIPKDERNAKAREWLNTVGLEGYEDQYPSQLSGGQQQRVGLARALCTDPEVLLMDEAFSALDPLIRSGMQDQLMELQDKLRKTIVFITHDLDEALRLGDRIAILKDGVLSQVGRPEEILLNPADDYVEAFVRDVNRARVLSVDVLMKPPQCRLTTANIDEALKKMRGWDEDYGYVFHDDEYQGVVTQDTLEEVCETPEPNPPLHEVCEEGPTLQPDTALQDALPAALESDYPVPVLDEDGEYQGTICKQDMVEVLANSNEDDTDEKASSAA
ncbi:glycine betaine/L-proline ABC transporter ATP-binding protein [Magnetovibrio sp. PR-2]|uniref:quaternary amine ABC transporter ATP-binding protein n=1 Tax=Magnetovibrio sp. PR-2 TaxID=3120356 RepID=UPI002FCE0DE9